MLSSNLKTTSQQIQGTRGPLLALKWSLAIHPIYSQIPCMVDETVRVDSRLVLPQREMDTQDKAQKDVASSVLARNRILLVLVLTS